MGGYFVLCHGVCTASSCLLWFRRVALLGGLIYADATSPRCTCQHTQSSDLTLEAHFLVRLAAAATFESLLRVVAQVSIDFICIADLYVLHLFVPLRRLVRLRLTAR